jgi:excinuclease UvrABC ATPase subunit
LIKEKQNIKTGKNSPILVEGARVHNLKNINVEIPRNKLIVITGLSGSGKSSLAFDTLYAEGQRRYVESLSSYARQFLGKLDKPDVDHIRGISPAVAIEQKVISRNPRSTVGTITEIYDYLKLLYARIGRTFSPVSGKEVKRETAEDVVQFLLSFPKDTRTYIMCPLILKDDRPLKRQLEILLQQGYTRVQHEGEIYEIESFLKSSSFNKKGELPKAVGMNIVIDRLSINPEDEDMRSRIHDSAESAFFEGQGECIIEVLGKKNTIRSFTNRFEMDGMIFEEPSVHFFTFNNPVGACKTCDGFGSVIGIDPDLVIPNKGLSLYDDCVACWKGDTMSEWKNDFIKKSTKFNFPIHKAYADLTKDQKKLLWEGNKGVEGINDFFKYVETQLYKIQYRVMLSRYRGKTACPDCHGTRLRKDADYVLIHETSLSHLLNLPITRCQEFFAKLKLNEHDAAIAKRILVEIKSRLQFLCDVGLGYLTLNRQANTLSGGESQRINLATSLGSSLVGSLYILDEPSIGLHPRDTQRLLSVLTSLRDLGNTVIVVEHDEEVMRAADMIIDMGPMAGTHGGEVVFIGSYAELGVTRIGVTRESPEITTAPIAPEITTAPIAPEITTAPIAPEITTAPIAPEITTPPIAPEKNTPPIAPEITTAPIAPEITTPPITPEKNTPQITPENVTGIAKSITAKYLTGIEKIELPKARRKWKDFIRLEGVRENNLKNINISFPLDIMTVVTGVSGSGKSSLVKRVLHPAITKHLGGYGDKNGDFDKITGSFKKLKAVEFIDQNPIGKSSRSNPVTYVKAYDEIRNLYASQQLSKLRGFKPSHFSFNVDGGRCESCDGEGTITVEMQFMADVHLLCEECKGKRFKDEVLEVIYEGKSVYDLLCTTIDDAIEFFSKYSKVHNDTEAKIIQRLKPLQDVGLGYVTLGQSSSTLSGGEAQRIKLASFLTQEKSDSGTLFIFDEPTTGLHFYDIHKLLYALNALIEKGNSVIIIEHNPDVIKCADWLIDIGPEGGEEGGNILYEGTPEGLIKVKDSYTGKFLASKF